MAVGGERHRVRVQDPAARLPPHCSQEGGLVLGPDGMIDRDTSIGERCSIAALVTISRGAVIGDDCLIGEGSLIGRDAELGNDVTVGANAMIGKDDLDPITGSVPFKSYLCQVEPLTPRAPGAG